jgi:hypothetical protein
MNEIPSSYRGWWRITETSQWGDDDLDILGPALLSLTGHGDRLRMHCLLAYVNCKPTKTGVAFTWKGAWEYDQMSGSGRVTLGKDGRLKGTFRIKDGDSSTFTALRTEEPDGPIPAPPELSRQVAKALVRKGDGARLAATRAARIWRAAAGMVASMGASRPRSCRPHVSTCSTSRCDACAFRLAISASRSPSTLSS